MAGTRRSRGAPGSGFADTERAVATVGSVGAVPPVRAASWLWSKSWLNPNPPTAAKTTPAVATHHE